MLLLITLKALEKLDFLVWRKKAVLEPLHYIGIMERIKTSLFLRSKKLNGSKDFIYILIIHSAVTKGAQSLRVYYPMP